MSTEMVTALRHDRRRALLEQLLDHDGNLSLVTLASQLAAVTGTSLPDVVIELHDIHLPELTACGLLVYDSDTGAVTLAVDPAVAEAAVERARADE